jgi:glycosyltransferase involved in cell wall biosynthesis
MLTTLSALGQASQASAQTFQNRSSALVLGRGIHGPWNEGGRVITRNLIQVIGQMRPVHALSLSQERFRQQASQESYVSHLYNHLEYGAKSDYLAVPHVAKYVKQLVQEHPVDVAHLINVPLALAPILHNQGVKVVTHVLLTRQMYQGTVERARAVLGWRLFDPWISAYACNCEQIREGLLAQGYPKEKLHLVPPPTDTNLFKPMDRAAARRKLGLPEDAFIVAYIGTISPLRFPAGEIVQALQKAAPQIPNLRLEIFAPVATHGYNIEWAKEHTRHAEESAIPMTTNLRDLSEVEKVVVYNAADVVLLPFTAPVAVEPPLTMLEAMACQAIVAAAPFANRSAITNNSINGTTYETPDQLAERLVFVANMSRQERVRMAYQARQDMIQYYSFAAAAEATRHLWEAIGIQQAVSATSLLQQQNG